MKSHFRFFGYTVFLLGVCFLCSGYKSAERSTAKDRRIKHLQAKIEVMDGLLARKDAKIKWLGRELDDKHHKQASQKMESSKETSPESPAIGEDPIDSNTAVENMPESPMKTDAPTIYQIQLALQKAGFYEGPLTGYMGPLTYEAIRQFQTSNQLVNDGYVGPETWNRLKTTQKVNP